MSSVFFLEVQVFELIDSDIKMYIDLSRKEKNFQYFQGFTGGYGEGDEFYGVAVPDIRKVVKKYEKGITLNEIERMLLSKIHEIRLAGVLFLVSKYQKSKMKEERIHITQFYLSHLEGVNNWDIVDSSAHHILGAAQYHYKGFEKAIEKLTKSEKLWENRVAMISTLYAIRKNDYDAALEIAQKLIDHPHDLIHKAVGWMIREIGERNLEVEKNFLKKYYKKMPRTMLRYAIEKFSKEERVRYLRSEI